MVDLRKINNSKLDDYKNIKHPVSTLMYAAQHFAWKNTSVNWTSHKHMMAHQRSIEMLAFNFACCTFAHRRLAQNFSRALSAFSRFIREYPDKVNKADQCAQYRTSTLRPMTLTTQLPTWEQFSNSFRRQALN